MEKYKFPLPCYELTDTIIGIYYSTLSSFSAPRGIPEKTFRDVFVLRLKSAGLRAEAEKPIVIRDKGEYVRTLHADIVIEDLVVVELKNVKKVSDKHIEQDMNYMDYGGCPVGLIFNYGQPKSLPQRLPRPSFYHKEPKKCPDSK